MFDEKPILIIEDNSFLALDLSQAIEVLNGRVVGPVNQVSDALELLEEREIAAAIVDCHLTGQNVTALVDRLADRQIPFIIYAETKPPEALDASHPDVPVLRKPVNPRMVMNCLLAEMQKHG